MAAKHDKFRLIAGGKDSTKKKKGKARGASPKKRGIKTAILLSVLLLFLLAGIVIVSRYKVENVLVEGNVHYSNEEIADMVLKDRLSVNSLYLSLKYRNREIKDIPFIETMSVKVVSPDTIRIMVYEKTVAGFVEYMGRYMYFDRDGIVVESSGTRTAGVPQVTGIKFDHVVLYEPLPVENASIFQQILTITQMLSKYEILTDKIYFNDAYEITLYFDQVRARLGTGNLEEKIMRLKYILPRLSGESGVLFMENYEEGKENITFEKD